MDGNVLGWFGTSRRNLAPQKLRWVKLQAPDAPAGKAKGPGKPGGRHEGSNRDGLIRSARQTPRGSSCVHEYPETPGIT